MFFVLLDIKVLDPIDEVEEWCSRAETTVKTPTKAVIPMAIINTVRVVRNICVLMEQLDPYIFFEYLASVV
jgi:hypothetical protein